MKKKLSSVSLSLFSLFSPPLSPRSSLLFSCSSSHLKLLPQVAVPLGQQGEPPEGAHALDAVVRQGPLVGSPQVDARGAGRAGNVLFESFLCFFEK